MVRLYALTSLGRRLAQNTTNPDTSNWRVVHYLRNMGGFQTPEQISDGTGMDSGTVAASLAQLRRGGVVAEASGTKGLD